MKRCFITFAEGENYQKLANILKESIDINSEYKLKIYQKKDFAQDYDLRAPKKFIYKILCCLDAIKYYDEVVFIDCDAVATRNIDKIWFESYRLKEYPLLPLSRFNIFDEKCIDQKKYTFLNNEALQYFNILAEKWYYRQACFLFFNKKSIDFFNLVLEYFKIENFINIFHFEDETIINCLLIKYNYNDNLGDIFLCSYYFNNILDEYLKIQNREDYLQIFKRFSISYNNYENILFFHGSKDCELHNKYLRLMKKKTVCIATQSTSQCKYWNNPNGWIKTVDYLKSLGYDVICIDRNSAFGINSHMNFIPPNCIDKTGNLPLQDRINDLQNCEFFIGLGSGLSWLAWACNKPVILISGFSDPKSEFYTPYRVHNKNVCNSCWNDTSVRFDPSNWMWCPRNKNFECSREITFEMVKEKIDQCIKDLNISS